jgi:molecular chaperone GrpE
VADEEQTSADNVAEVEAEESAAEAEPSQEEIIAVWRDKYMRLQAEFDNYRKRTLREKMDLVASGGSDVIKSMLSVLDDMYRAVAASEKSEDITALREGEKLVLQKFEEALRQKNVTEIEAVGKEFDPDFHEAVARFAAGEDKKGKVIDVVQRGYMLGEKVLRYAKVVVGE